MENIDPSTIDTSGLVGQVSVALFGLAAVITAATPLLRGLFKGRKLKGKPKDYNSLVEELDRSKREVVFQSRLINRLHDWQLTARQLIYLYRAEFTANGIKEKARIVKFVDELDRIDEIDVYDYLSEEEVDNGSD